MSTCKPATGSSPPPGPNETSTATLAREIALSSSEEWALSKEQRNRTHDFRRHRQVVD